MSRLNWCTVLPVLMLLIGGCSVPDRSEVDARRHAGIDPGLSAAANLERLAARDAGPTAAMPPSLPEPPGVEPGALARRTVARAAMPLDEAIASILAEFNRDEERLAEQSSTTIDAPSGSNQSEATQFAGEPGNDDERDASDNDAAVAERAALRHYIKGREAALADRHYVAITELNRALELDPHSPAIRRELARSYLTMDNQSRAEEQFTAILEIVDDDAEAIFTLALLAAGRRDVETAASLLARRFADHRGFPHDPAADVLAAFTFSFALRQLGYDRASIVMAHRAAEADPSLLERTVYGGRLQSLLQQRSDLWRAVGDAHCRLGEYEDALYAYERSSAHPSTDPASLHPRVIYANLMLGRTYRAQYELLTAIERDHRSISDRDIRLCAYLADHVPQVDLLAEAVREMYQQHPGSPDLVRAAAALLPREQSLPLLREFVDRRPRDLDVVSHLVGWLGERDIPAAVDLAITLIEHHPDLAGPYSKRLLYRVPEPPALLAAIQRAGEQPAVRHLHARLLTLLGAKGEAWSEVTDARAKWPRDRGLLWAQVEFAAALGEPALLREVAEEAESFDDVQSWITTARAHRMMGDVEAAVRAAERAVDLSDQEAERPGDGLRLRALIALAKAYAAYAETRESEAERTDWAEEAARIARRASELEEAGDEPFEIMLRLFGPNGILRDGGRFRHAALQLYERDPDSRLYARAAAEESLSHGRYDQAVERLVNLYENDPSDLEALALAIRAWAQQDQLDTARRWLDEKIRHRPHDPALLEQWVHVTLMMNKYAEAERVLRDLLERDEAQFPARGLLERVYRSVGQMERALPLGEQRLLSRPEGVRREVELAAMYGGVGMEQAAIERLKWFAGAVEDATQEQILTAIAILSRFEQDLHRTEELTLRLTDAAIARDPRLPLQVYGSGLRAMARLDRIDDEFDALAEKAAMEARGAQSPRFALEWRELAQALVDLDQPRAAGRAVRQMLLIDRPLEPDAVNLLAAVTIAADAAAHGGKRQADQTIRLVNELNLRNRLPRLLGSEERPTVPRVIYQSSHAYSLLGDEEGAEHLLINSVELDAGNSTALNNLGYMRIEAGLDDPSTIGWIERAYELDPEKPHILDTIGWLRYRHGRFTDDDDGPGALTLIKRSLDQDDEESPEVLDHLGDTYWRLGRYEDAAAAWRAAERELADPAHREQMQQLFQAIQIRGWGLLVTDPAALYDQRYGKALERVRQKLDAVESGREPTIAPTFAELRE